MNTYRKGIRRNKINEKEMKEAEDRWEGVVG